MSNRGFYQTQGAFGPMTRQNQRPARFTRPLNPGAWQSFRPTRIGVAPPSTQTLAGNPAKSCCSDCAKDGRNG